VEIKESIDQVDKGTWNRYLGGQGVYDWEGLKFLERVFQGNERKEHNWLFRYVLIKDGSGTPVLMTFLTLSLWKDDMLADAQVSKAIEEERKTDSYHLSSMVLSMGCLFTEGDHLYWDASHGLAGQALDVFLELVEKQEQSLGAKMTLLRDFPKETLWNSALYGHGFLRVQMPNSCTVDLSGFQSMELYLAKLSSRNRRHFRKDIRPFLENSRSKTISKVPSAQLMQFKRLFGEVQSRNLGLNTFSFPDALFQQMNENPLWEFIVLTSNEKPDRVLGVMFCYNNNGQVYVPAFVGMAYGFLEEYATYRQLLYRTIERVIELGIPKIDFGMTAAFEKRKLGASIHEKYAYLQTRDNFVLELLGVMEGQH
ncbi:GNAT family N-acetyltransferase, partial [Flagellimonas pacifica]